MKIFATFSGMLSVLFFVILVSACQKNNSSNNPPASKTPGLQLIADSLVSPVFISEPPDSSHRLFVVDEIGKIWIIGADGKKLTTPFIDVTNKMVTLSPSYDERGLLGLAFSPQFKTNGKFYIFYTAPPRPGTPVPGPPGSTWNNLTRISEFKVSASDPNQADLSSERVLIEDNHPYLNHNAGTLAFGPDGFLYISIGDGGNADDVGNGHVPDWYTVNAGGNGQDLYANLMGDILRIDVNGNPYNIPADNPFFGTPAARPEIYAFGFRNPFRFSFDMGGTHQLIVGDEGQSLYEEIDLITKGGNYGWNVKEGTHCFDTDNDTIEKGFLSLDGLSRQSTHRSCYRTGKFCESQRWWRRYCHYRGLCLPGNGTTTAAGKIYFRHAFRRWTSNRDCLLCRSHRHHLVQQFAGNKRISK